MTQRPFAAPRLTQRQIRRLSEVVRPHELRRRRLLRGAPRGHAAREDE
jgi:hypothetical protein